MAKFRYNGDVPATVYLNGQAYQLEPGDTVETDDDAAKRGLLVDNSDFSEVKASPKVKHK